MGSGSAPVLGISTLPVPRRLCMFMLLEFAHSLPLGHPISSDTELACGSIMVSLSLTSAWPYSTWHTFVAPAHHQHHHHQCFCHYHCHDDDDNHNHNDNDNDDDDDNDNDNDNRYWCYFW